MAKTAVVTGKLMMRTVHQSLSASVGIAVALMSTPAEAGAISVDLKGAGELVDAITRALKNLPELFEKSFATSDNIRRKQEAFSARDKLKTLSRRLSVLSTGQKAFAINAADNYIQNQSDANWVNFQQSIAKVIEVAGGIENDFATNDTDFILQKPYREIMASLRSRSFVLGPLVKIPRPKSEQDMRKFKEFTVKYRNLVENLDSSIDKFNDYIQSLQ